MSRRRLWRRHDEIPVIDLQKSNPVRFGIVLIVLTAIVVYFGFTKHIPFKHGYRLKAQFATVVNIRPKSPVRIAGVGVGKVVSIKRQGNTGLVTMEIEKGGLPIHSDATLKIRPRIFLEGNFFIDLQPGSPSAKTIPSGYTIPITQTSDPVQLDQVLTALNTDTRANLQTFLQEYGEALTHKPDAAENAAQDPDVRGLDGAEAINKAYHRGPEALRGSTIVGQAFAGSEQHDLSELVSGIEHFTAGLNVHEQELGELIDNFDTFLGSFAAQSSNLHATVVALPGALKNANGALTALDAAFPSIRTFATDLAPGVKETPATVDAAFPWIEQVQASLAPTELGGVAKGLRGTGLWLARLTGGQTSFQHQADQFSQCLTKVFFPAATTKLEDGPNSSGVNVSNEFWYTMAGLAGAGQNFDGNGASTRFLTGSGGVQVVSPKASVVATGARTEGVQLVAHTPSAPEGTRPRFPGSEPPYKPFVPCYTQTVPNFNGPLASGPADGSGG
jgi:phospholipid/cholesterol/gamma-HCH transport system substrate-binding protein